MTWSSGSRSRIEAMTSSRIRPDTLHLLRSCQCWPGKWRGPESRLSRRAATVACGHCRAAGGGLWSRKFTVSRAGRYTGGIGLAQRQRQPDAQQRLADDLSRDIPDESLADGLGLLDRGQSPDRDAALLLPGVSLLCLT